MAKAEFIELSPAKKLELAYKISRRIAKQHYENFPLGLFLPPKLTNAVYAIYAFARTADDFADEGDLNPATRLKNLDKLASNLNLIAAKKIDLIDDPICYALNDTIKTFNLSIKWFFQLLCAFKQDVIQNRYETFNELLAYCNNSANPIGRLLLELTNQTSASNAKLSDAICTSLQLINFLQDVTSDIIMRGRLYLPLNELYNYGLTMDDLLKTPSKKVTEFFSFQIRRIHTLLAEGSELGYNVRGLFGLELRCIVTAANSILRRLQIRKQLSHQPRIKLYHGPYILLTALFKKLYERNRYL